jgi:hypothetical protein
VRISRRRKKMFELLYYNQLPWNFILF